jgi:ubiquinone/menaquinone biosynthesis C-methylase UbiE
MASGSPQARLTKLIRSHWDDRATTFDAEADHGVHSRDQREAWVSLLSGIAGPEPRRALDVGCGTGVLTLMLAEMGHTVTGVDFAPRMLRIAEQKSRRAGLAVRFRLENVTALSDRDATYDLVIARHVIWALPNPALGAREWLRVLRPGGRLVLIEGYRYSKSEAPVVSTAKKTPVAESMRSVLRILYYGVKERKTALIPSKLRYLIYRRAQSELPFPGGLPAERLAAILQAEGIRDLALTPLMDPALWGGDPQYPRYLAIGTRP